MGYPRFKGGLGGYPRCIAICPPDSKCRVSVGEVPDVPLPKSNRILKRDFRLGVRVRD